MFQSKRWMALIIFSLVLAGCGSANIVVAPDFRFTKNDGVVVLVAHDPYGVGFSLEHSLLSQGFNVVSAATVGVARETKNASQAVPGAAASRQSTQDVINVPTRYVFRVAYASRIDALTGSVYITRLAATLVDLATDRTIASVEFSGLKSINAALLEVVRELEHVVERKRL